MSTFNDGKTSTLLGLGKPFNIDSISHDVRRNLAKVDPRLPEEIKNVTLLLKEEKNVLSSLQNTALERKQGKYGNADMNTVSCYYVYFELIRPIFCFSNFV